MKIENFCPAVVVNASPVLDPTENPANDVAPALAPFVTNRMHDPSIDGAVIVYAPLFVVY